MGMTLTQKILAKKAGLKEVKAGQLIEVDVDMALGNDITTPVAIKGFDKFAIEKVFAGDKVSIVLDHFTPNKDIKSAENSKLCREFAKEKGVENFFDVGDMGIEHCILPEKGLVGPLDIVIGADSHTCTYGAISAFSTGVGSTDLACAMASSKAWFKIPAGLKFNLQGEPGPLISGKDVILHIIGLIGVDGALYKSMEFVGDGVKHLSIDDRFTICNMAIEAGAKNGIFSVDDVTRAYLTENYKKDYETLEADSDAIYEKEYLIELDKLEPTISFPHLPDNTRTISEVDDIKIDQIVIGSCTNGRISDLKVAAKILQGKKVKEGVRAIVIPGSQKIYLEALRLGYIETFIKSGAIVSTPTCGPCLGGHMGILAKGERCVATTNRNFVGRMGHVESEVYLASPAIAAASALTGKISSPDEL